jgi:predicted P-loop ATPase
LQPISDVYESVILNWLYDVGFSGKDRMTQAISQAAAMNRYHPIKEFFSSLEWDGKDHIAGLLSHFRFSRETDVFAQAAIKRWMIGAVAKIFEQGQNYMLVIDGNQGIGKSYLVRWLCPLPKFFIEGAIHTDDKDSYLRLISYLVWEVGELEGVTRRADRAGLKDFITRREVTQRPPYGKHDVVKPASASLVGTINEDGAGFLNDPTGSRRFAVVKVEEIDRAYSETVNVNQLWAQVYELYKMGEAWELEYQEKAAQVEINKAYEADSPVEEHLKQLYEWGGKVPDDLFIPSIEILGSLKMAGLSGNDKLSLMEISTVLKREGLVKTRRNGSMGFTGIRKKMQ